jgi:hypothetical protein
MAQPTAQEMERIRKVCREYCGECPTYAGTGEKELGFCVGGKSRAISEENGCLCMGCPITGEYSLKGEYYCIRGSGTPKG